MAMLKLPNRTKEKRTFGITSIADFGISIGELKSILDDYSEFIDFAKMGIGTAYVTPKIKEKIQLYKEYDIEPYCGGTLFEKAFFQDKIDDYFVYLKQLGIEWIEISTGVLDIPLETRISLVEKCKQNFRVIGEVGSKDGTIEMSASEWQIEMIELIHAGCEYVIAEGRDSGTAGIYETNGKIKESLVSDVTEKVDFKKIIFEAPTTKSQMFFINQFGPNVNLGNVKLQDVLLLEAQRCGLRAETFFLEEIKWKLIL